jgi:hypothetical protein
MTAHVILEIVALICLLAAAGRPTGRVSIGWAGMALWLLAELVVGGGVLLR